MTGHVVTGRGVGSVFPYVVATNEWQLGALVDLLLGSPAGPPDDDRLHSGATFYVGDRPQFDHAAGDHPARWLRIGFHHGVGGAFFCDETTTAGSDWAWLALAADPPTDGSLVYFDQDAESAFPPRSVMALDRLRAVVLEWVETGQRPTSVRWLPINSLVWQLTDDGRPVVRDSAG